MDNASSQEKTIEQARRFADEEIRPRAREFDENQELPKDVIAAMAERKLLLASLPEEQGGLGLDPVHYGFLTEAIGKACCSTVGLITVQSSLVGETLLRWGSGEMKEQWLPPIRAKIRADIDIHLKTCYFLRGYDEYYL